jgi:hypothetical protein
VFDRSLLSRNVASRVLGIGHTLFDMALDEACDLPVNFTILQEMKHGPFADNRPIRLYVARIERRAAMYAFR